MRSASGVSNRTGCRMAGVAARASEQSSDERIGDMGFSTSLASRRGHLRFTATVASMRPDTVPAAVGHVALGFIALFLRSARLF